MGDGIYDVYHQEIELTKEQKACLKYTGDKTLMVKGYAGAGKSLVLMAIAQKYLEKYGRASKNKIAFFTYQNTLVSTMKEFLQVNMQSEDGVVVSTINSYIYDLYTWLANNGKAPKRRWPYHDKKGDEERIKNVRNALDNHKKRFGKHRFHDLDPQFWLEEFEWMKDMNVWTDDLDYYLTLPRKGRGSNVRMNSQDRVTAYQIFVCYCNYLSANGKGDWEDQTLFIVRHPELIPENKKFEHILVDEAQDLSLAQMSAIMQLYNKDMIVAMDMNQKIHSRYWTPRLLGIETTTKKLTKSMRTTVQIEALAESIRKNNDINLSDDDISLRAIPERKGEKPILVHLDSPAAEQKYVIQLVKAYIKDNDKATIGIIAAKNEQIKRYSEWLTSASIKHEQIKKDSTFSMAKPGVKVVSAYGAKGLEFDRVIIPMFNEGYFPFNYHTDDNDAMVDFLIKMRNLVYVSMTRAKHTLRITFSGNNGSRFIGEMDPKLFDWEGTPFTPSKSLLTRQKYESDIEMSNIFDDSSNRSHNGKKIETKTEKTIQKDQSPTLQLNDLLNLLNTAKENDLKTFLESNNLEVIDKRNKGGALWVVGGEGIHSILNESRKKYGALWTKSVKGGSATNYRPGWFTKSTR